MRGQEQGLVQAQRQAQAKEPVQDLVQAQAEAKELVQDRVQGQVQAKESDRVQGLLKSPLAQSLLAVV